MLTLRSYIESLSCPAPLFRTLRGVAIPRDTRHLPAFAAGNTAVVLRAAVAGHSCALRCFLRSTPRRREIYGARLLERELYLPTAREWADVVVSEWVEGPTLHDAVLTAIRNGDRAELRRLGAAFETLAAELVADDWAHGDLKPENIIVTPAGELQLIDFDAVFLPAFKGCESPELGTAAFQHPARTVRDFDAHLDDYPAALIATTLAAIAADDALAASYVENNGILFEPRNIRRERNYAAMLRLFMERGDVIRYRMAQLLTFPSYQLPALPQLLRYAAETRGATPCDDMIELFVESGWWGYRTSRRIISPPLWTCGFDFSEGLAAVQLNSSWHYIDTAGRVVASFPDAEGLKPVRDGIGVVIRRGVRQRLTREGGGFCEIE